MNHIGKKEHIMMLALVFVITVVVGVPSTQAAADGAQASLSDGRAREAAVQSWRLREPSDAVEVAARVLGMDPSRTRGCEALAVILPDENTPFLSKEHAGRTVWRVTVPDWIPDPHVASLGPEVGPRRGRQVDVLIDPLDETLIKVETRWPDKERSPVAPMDAPSEEKDLLASQERYHGFPVSFPPVSLADALQILDNGGAQSDKAKQISALWVIWSQGQRDPKPMWVITLRSVAASVLTFEDRDAAARSQWRYVVDPDSKQLFCWTNLLPRSSSGKNPGMADQ